LAAADTNPLSHRSEDVAFPQGGNFEGPTNSLKQLSSSDVALLKELLKVFGEAFEEMETYQSAIPSDAYLGLLLSKPHFIVLVAMDDNEVVGGLADTNWRNLSRTGEKFMSTTWRSRNITAEKA
jgi:hypothetical protein